MAIRNLQLQQDLQYNTAKGTGLKTLLNRKLKLATNKRMWEKEIVKVLSSE